MSDIWDYIAADNIAAADRMVDRLLEACRAFAYTPELGCKREELRSGLRSFPVGNYLIFYRFAPERVDVLRILHGARELDALFESKGEETFDAER